MACLIAKTRARTILLVADGACAKLIRTRSQGAAGRLVASKSLQAHEADEFQQARRENMIYKGKRTRMICVITA